MRICSKKCDYYEWCKTEKDICAYCIHEDDAITYATCDKCNKRTCNFEKKKLDQ